MAPIIYAKREIEREVIIPGHEVLPAALKKLFPY